MLPANLSARKEKTHKKSANKLEKCIVPAAAAAVILGVILLNMESRSGQSHDDSADYLQSLRKQQATAQLVVPQISLEEALKARLQHAESEGETPVSIIVADKATQIDNTNLLSKPADNSEDELRLLQEQLEVEKKGPRKGAVSLEQPSTSPTPERVVSNWRYDADADEKPDHIVYYKGQLTPKPQRQQD
jgi:hypothetical protein